MSVNFQYQNNMKNFYRKESINFSLTTTFVKGYLKYFFNIQLYNIKSVENSHESFSFEIPCIGITSVWTTLIM